MDSQRRTLTFISDKAGRSGLLKESMMSRLAKKLSAGAALTLATTGLFAPAAFASGSTSTTTTRQSADLAAIKAKAAAAISRRESALTSAVTAVTNNPYLTADRTTILTTLSADQSGLNALGPVIQADTTVSQAESDYRSIFTGYRVFALRLPQARFAESADDLTGTVLPHLTDAQSKLQALLSGPDSGKDTPTVRAAMADLATQINSITSDTSGLSATVLGFTPAQYNANPAILSGPRAQLGTARSDSHKAEADIHTVIEALQ